MSKTLNDDETEKDPEDEEGGGRISIKPNDLNKLREESSNYGAKRHHNDNHITLTNLKDETKEANIIAAGSKAQSCPKKQRKEVKNSVKCKKLLKRLKVSWPKQKVIIDQCREKEIGGSKPKARPKGVKVSWLKFKNKNGYGKPKAQAKRLKVRWPKPKKDKNGSSDPKTFRC